MWAMMWGTERPTPGEVDCDCLFFLIFFLDLSVSLSLHLSLYLILATSSHITCNTSAPVATDCHHDVQLVSGSAVSRIHGFNVESEFLSLFVHGFKTAESRNNLIVANLTLQKHSWVAIFCKTPPNPQDKEATRDMRKKW